MNYRVSVFGYLYLNRPEAPGNMGLWDQVFFYFVIKIIFCVNSVVSIKMDSFKY